MGDPSSVRIAPRADIQTDKEELDLRHILRTLWRGKFTVFFFTLLAIILGGVYAFVIAVPIYTSNAIVALESRQDQVVDIESVVTGLSGDQTTINTEVEVMRSRGLLEKVITELNLIDDPEFNETLRPEPTYDIGKAISFVREDLLSLPPAMDTGPERPLMDDVIDNLLDALSISNQRQSYVFHITARTEAAQKSADIANTLADLYILEQLEAKFEATEKATAWLSERVGELQIELEVAEATVKDFNASVDLVSPAALTGLNRQIKELRDRLRETRNGREETAAFLGLLQAARASADPEQMAVVAQDQPLSRLKETLNTAEDRAAFDARFDQLIARAELDIRRADNQIDALQSTIAGQEEQIARQSDDLVRLQQLQREAEASRSIYEFFLGRLKETSVQAGIQQADSRVLSRAVIAVGPSSPRKPLVLALSMLLGLMIGIALVLMREFSQNTFRTARELEDRTGYPVIGTLPLIPARRRKNVLKYLTSKPTSAAAEAIRNLRTSVLLSNVQKPPQLILSTSSIPQEGKTTLSLALAQNLFGLGKRVLLIEGDIRRSVFGDYFHAQGKPGLLSVLSGAVSLEEAVVTEDTFKADVLLGEKSMTNAADLFSSDPFLAFLKDIRAKYDYIIIDTPPVLAVPDARIIGQHADAVLYTVRWDKTSYDQVRDGLRAFEAVNINVTGLILSQVNARGMKRYGHKNTHTSYSAYYDA